MMSANGESSGGPGSERWAKRVSLLPWWGGSGPRVSEQGGAGPDGGIDLVLSKGSEKFLVQCKQWKAFKVSVTVVRDLYGVMAVKGAAGGFVVTSGRFTDEATAFASGRNIKLIDGPLLHGLIS